MYAVIRTGGKQYRVTSGDVIRVERLAGDEGATLALEDVLAVGDGDKIKLGVPLVSGAKVEAEIVSQTRGPKITVFKKKRRKGYKRTAGHRQDLTVLRIGAIKA